MIRARSLLASVLVLALISAGCSGGEPQAAPAPPTSNPESLAFSEGDEPEGRETLRISIPRLALVAPHVVDETDPLQLMVTDLLTDGLTELDPATGFSRPALAEDWSISRDRLTWTFTLADTEFSTGQPVTAADVVASLNRVAARGVDSLTGANLEVITGYDAVAGGEASEMSGVTAIDEKTVEIVLAEPYEPLPDLLAGVPFGVFPMEIDTSGDLPLSSSVAYRPTAAWDAGFRMSAVDRESGIESIEIWVDPDAQLIVSGEVDVALGLEPDAVPGSVSTATVPRTADAFLAMNQSVAPFDDPLVREAIIQAIDREALRDEFFPAAEVMTGFLPESVAGGSADACAERCDFNRRAASRKVRRSNRSEVAFTVDFFVDEQSGDSEQRMAEQIVVELRKVGLNATARAHPVEEYAELVAAGELDLFRFGSVSSTLVADADLASKFATGARDNVTNASLEVFDNLIVEGRRTLDDEERARIYRDAEAVLMRKSVVVPLVEFQHLIAHSAAIESISLEADGSLDLDSIVFAGG